MGKPDREPGVSPDGSSANGASGGLRGHFRAHARPLLGVAVASGIGIVASFAFHLLSVHALDPDEFGLLASFFVIVNVAAIGSSSLQNAVTVQTAAQPPSGTHLRFRDRIPRDALILGGIGAVVVAILSPWLARTLETSPALVIAAALSMPLSFVFADAVGLLQGSGQVTRAVTWSTLSQIARVVFAVLVIVTATGLGGMIGAVMAALVLSVVGVVWTARKVRRPRIGVFSADGVAIMLLTVAFAWLTNSDTIYLRAGAPAELAGTYASAAILVKTGFLVPTTLSLYLLPRFVRNRDDTRLSRLGVAVTLASTVLGGLAMCALFFLFGSQIVSLVFPGSYALASEILVPASLAYLPWIAAQGMLIKMTSAASRGAAVLVLLAVIAQWAAFTATIPDLYTMLLAHAAIGTAVLVGFIAIDLRQARAARTQLRGVRG